MPDVTPTTDVSETDSPASAGRERSRVASPSAGDRPPRNGGGRGLIGDSAAIAAASALSRITGLLRIVVAASVLGSTVLGDLFVAINVLPLTLYDVFAGSAISSVLVPPLVRFLDRDERTAARRFTANALGLIVAVMAAVAAVGVLARPLIARALTAGVEPALSADAIAVAGLLLLLIVPQLILYAAIGVFVSVQHANRRFLLPSAAPILENLGLLATIGVAWASYGGGLEVDRAPDGLVLTLAIGSGLSVGLHALVQLWGARRALGSFGLGRRWRDSEIRALLQPTRSSFGWSSVIALRQFALVVAAGFAGAGGVQAFEMATLAYFIPVALIGRPIASAALPRLAGNGATDRDLVAGYRTTLRLAAWLAVPAGLALVLLGEPLADLIGQGRFSGEEATRMLLFGLAGLGLGAASEALFEVARQTMMAGGRTAALTTSTWIRATAAIVGIPAVVLLLDGAPVLLGLGLVVSAGDLAALAVAHRALTAIDDRPTGDEVRHGPRILAAAAVGLGPGALVAATTDLSWGPLPLLTLLLVTATAFAAAAWLTTGRGRLVRSLASALNDEALL